MAERSPTSVVLYLDEGMEGDVLITTKDRDKFLVPANHAVQACSAYENAAQCTNQFFELVEALGEWVNERKDRVKSAYVTIREDDILFLVMQKGIRFDQELTDDLTELDLQIANDKAFDLIRFNVLSVPAASQESLTAFHASGSTYSYNAK